MNTATSLLPDDEMRGVIEEVVGDDTSAEFITLTSHYIDGNGLTVAMRAHGTNWDEINELTSKADELAKQKLCEKQNTSN